MEKRKLIRVVAFLPWKAVGADELIPVLGVRIRILTNAEKNNSHGTLFFLKLEAIPFNLHGQE